MTSFSHIGACLLKVNKLWGTFVRDACDIGNFLVKESGQVSTTMMGTRECPLFWENCGRMEGAVQGFVASGRSENVSAGVILEQGG